VVWKGKGKRQRVEGRRQKGKEEGKGQRAGGRREKKKAKGRGQEAEGEGRLSVRCSRSILTHLTTAILQNAKAVFATFVDAAVSQFRGLIPSLRLKQRSI
jgi:hypothetical protein